MYKNKMREIRAKKGMMLKELAEKTGITIGYLCHLEKGTRTNPSVQVMSKIADALDKDVKDVFFN